jgi:hypothetical protein
VIPSGNDQIGEKTFKESRKRLVEEVDKEAQNIGILNGHYCVFFLVPWRVPFTRKLKDRIKDELFGYIKKTKDEECSLTYEIKYRYRTVCQILKIDNNKNKIFAGFADGAWPESQQTQNYVCHLLQYAISN